MAAVEGGAGESDQPSHGEQRVAALAGQGTVGFVCRYFRTGGVSGDADRDGTGSVQRKAVKPSARLHSRRPGPAGRVDRFGGPRSDQGSNAGAAAFAVLRRYGQAVAAGAEDR